MENRECIVVNRSFVLMGCITNIPAHASNVFTYMYLQ